MSRSFELRGPAGRLEALLDPADPKIPREPRPGAVVAHPHPLRGGTFHNTVVYRTAKALASAGFDTLRFNFRGVGASEGTHDEGRGELEDYRAALEALAALGRAPLVACGYSFGAIQALRAAASDARVVAAVAIGYPIALAPADLLRSFAKPLAVIQGSADPLGEIAELERLAAEAPRARVFAIEGAGHFFEGKADPVAETAARFATEALATAAPPRPR